MKRASEAKGKEVEMDFEGGGGGGREEVGERRASSGAAVVFRLEVEEGWSRSREVSSLEETMRLM